MKKLTIAIIALALVCSCVFADSYSATAGFGFGGQMLLVNEPKTLMLPSAGPAAFAGFDYEFDNGLTLFDDLAFNLIMLNADPEAGKLAKTETKVVTLTEQLGAGYTFHVDQFDLMAGAGVGIRTAVAGLDKALGIDLKNEEIAAYMAEAGIKKVTFRTIDLVLRLKATYNIDKNWGVSFQLNPTYALMYKHTYLDMMSLEQPEMDLVGKFVGGNALIGATYKF